jgi:hypothetical protein
MREELIKKIIEIANNELALWQKIEDVEVPEWDAPSEKPEEIEELIKQVTKGTFYKERDELFAEERKFRNQTRKAEAHQVRIDKGKEKLKKEQERLGKKEEKLTEDKNKKDADKHKKQLANREAELQKTRRRLVKDEEKLLEEEEKLVKEKENLEKDQAQLSKKQETVQQKEAKLAAFNESYKDKAGFARITEVYAALVTPENKYRYPLSPWSAVFVSYVVNQAASELGVASPLRAETSHFGYAKAAFQEKRVAMYHAFRFEEAGEIQLGDIIITQRSEKQSLLKDNDKNVVKAMNITKKKQEEIVEVKGTAYDIDLTFNSLASSDFVPTHGDIVTAVANELTVIGGNVSNSVEKEKRPKKINTVCLKENNWELKPAPKDNASPPLPKLKTLYNCPKAEHWANATKENPAVVVHCPNNRHCRYFAVLRIVGDVTGEAKTGVSGSNNVITLTKEQRDLVLSNKP